MKLIYKLHYGIIILLDLIAICFTFNLWIEHRIFSALATSAIGIWFVYMFWHMHFEKKKVLRSMNLVIFYAYSISFLIKTYNMTRGSDEYMALMYPVFTVILAGFLNEIYPVKE